MKKPDEIKEGLRHCIEDADCTGCVYRDECMEEYDCRPMHADALAYIRQLEEDKKRLHERICNQRRSLRLLHAMYEWALGRLQKSKLNDRAHFQAWLRERGYDLTTMELLDAQVPKWISVDDPPKNSGRYLIMFEDGHCCDAEYDECIDFDSQFGEYVSIFDSCTLGFVDSEWRGYQEVTHWMPLPEPPKEG